MTQIFKQALTHYGAYLQQAPNGPLAEEAFLGTADAYRQLGHEDKEADTLRRFVERFPESSLISKARARLKQLSASTSL
jgi:TolA-binding protein